MILELYKHENALNSDSYVSCEFDYIHKLAFVSNFDSPKILNFVLF